MTLNKFDISLVERYASLGGNIVLSENTIEFPARNFSVRYTDQEKFDEMCTVINDTAPHP